MLCELYIENFALIDRLTVAFSPGLNILTGETGAGKSIVIDAINVLLGERAGTDLIRTGEARALLQATFDLTTAPAMLPALDEMGVEPEEGAVILTREVAREGRNVARINGRTVPISVLRQVGDLLVDLHGQHEHQSLIREEFHLSFLDALGDADFHALLAETGALAQRRSILLREWHDLQTDERDRLRAIDLVAFQVDEIEQAGLVPDEEDDLSAERLRLANAEKLHDAASTAYALLYESTDGGSVLDAIGEAQMRLAGLVRFDATLEPLATQLEASADQISDVCHELAGYRDRTQFDPERLEEVEERLTLIGKLKRKYGETIASILAYGEEKQAELRRLTHHEERRDEIQAEIHRVEAALAERAVEVSSRRQALAHTLAEGVKAELLQLGMPRAAFQVNLRRIPHAQGLPVDGETVQVTTKGIDDVAFFFSANAGEPCKPLAKIASGGELSRVMLALKAMSARGSGVPTLIFDEIDTGIGGRTAEAVGAKLAQVSGFAQVIAVTHLAQLAFYADRHFLLEKLTEADRTRSIMRELGYEERISELARLQAGGRVSEAVLSHVRTILIEIDGQKAGNPA